MRSIGGYFLAALEYVLEKGFLPMGQYGYYLCNFDIYDQDHVQTGVDRKVLSQVKVFNDAGLDCRFMYCAPADTRFRRGLGSLPGFTDGTDWPDVDNLGSPAYLYIRRPMYSSRELERFLERFKKKNPASVVVIEIPTYPYDDEFQGIENSFALMKDRKYRNRWHKYVDYVADLSGEDEIFGIPTLPIINGIDLSTIQPRTPSASKDDTIDIVFSAFFGPWHGCDLLLRGLAEYNRTDGARKVVLHLAGGGNMISEIESQISDLNLNDHVVMHGALNQKQLDDLFNTCRFAVSSLALHRISGTDYKASSLKTREYLAKGIPFVYAGKVDVFESNPVDFCLQLPPEEKATDFRAVVDFYDKIYSTYSEEDLIGRIRQYAENTVSMDAAMEDVVKVLKDK